MDGRGLDPPIRSPLGHRQERRALKILSPSNADLRMKKVSSPQFSSDGMAAKPAAFQSTEWVVLTITLPEDTWQTALEREMIVKASGQALRT